MNVGAQLQQARSARTLSLADVTKETKIQPWVLEALEADRLQEMMSPIYVKGFLTTYAKFLHLNPDVLVARLRWPQPQPQQEAVPPPAASKRPAFTWSWPAVDLRRLRIAAAATAALILVLLVRALPATAPTPKSAARAAKKSAAPAATASVAKPAPVLASVTTISEPIKPPEPPTMTVLATQPLELAITANRTTWVQIRSDGKLITQQRLPRGAQERWMAKKQFEIVVSKPSQVELTLNGQSISPFAIAHQGRLLITHRGVTRLPEGE